VGAGAGIAPALGLLSEGEQAAEDDVGGDGDGAVGQQAAGAAVHDVCPSVAMALICASM